jgi:hypothetical protein
MIPVSNVWKSAQNALLLPEMFVEITYEITEPGLQDEAVVSGSNPESFSDIDQVLNGLTKNSEKYAMLDYGCWGLDGSYAYFEGDPDDPGYVYADYSESDGSLSEYPMITIDFEKRHDVAIPGAIITWGDAFGVWAEEFRLSAWDGSGVIAQTTVVGNKSLVSVVSLDMVNYSKITVEILKWSHPYQRPRCIDVFLGVKAVYGKNDLLGFEHERSTDILSAVLPDNKIIFRLRNDDNRWNPDTPNGSIRYLSEQQEIRVRYGMDVGDSIEWINCGTFWISEWNTPTNGLEVSFTARDAVEFMIGRYTGTRQGNLYDMAVAAFEEAELTLLDDGSKRYVLDESLKEITTDFTDDGSDYTIAETLQMIANAGNCVFYQDRDGVVHIEPRHKEYSNYMIEPRISYAHPEYELSKPLKAILVEYGSEREYVTINVSKRGETQEMSNPMIMSEEHALRVGEAAKEVLENRKVVSGSFRADLRLDPLDNIVVSSKYASNILCITDVSYKLNGGAFKGEYTGRVMSLTLDAAKVFSNEFYSGDIW